MFAEKVSQPLEQNKRDSPKLGIGLGDKASCTDFFFFSAYIVCPFLEKEKKTP